MEVPVATVLKQNAYMLFFQRSSDEKNLKIKQNEKPKKTNASGKKAEDTPTISSTSQETKKKIKNPKHHIYTRESNSPGTEGLPQDFVVSIEVPLVMKPEIMQLNVSSTGTLSFQSAELYSLKVTNNTHNLMTKKLNFLNLWLFFLNSYLSPFHCLLNKLLPNFIQ